MVFVQEITAFLETITTYIMFYIGYTINLKVIEKFIRNFKVTTDLRSLSFAKHHTLQIAHVSP